MSQRNPMNQRYMDTDRKGATNKSSSSAKPKKRAGETVRVKPTDTPRDKKSRKKAQRDARAKRAREDDRRIAASGGPTSPEYKKWRRIWWVFMIATIVFIVAYAIGGSMENPYMPVMTVLMTLAYVSLIIAFVIEFKFVRPIRKEYSNKIKSMSNAKKRKLDEEIALKEAEKQAEKQARRESSAVGKAVGNVSDLTTRAAAGVVKTLGLGGKNKAVEKAEKIAEEVQEEKQRLVEAKQAAEDAPKRRADSKQNTRKKTPAQKRAERAAKERALEGKDAEEQAEATATGEAKSAQEPASDAGTEAAE